MYFIKSNENLLCCHIIKTENNDLKIMTKKKRDIEYKKNTISLGEPIKVNIEKAVSFSNIASKLVKIVAIGIIKPILSTSRKIKKNIKIKIKIILIF